VVEVPVGTSYSAGDLDSLENLPPLSHIGTELERYFSIARKMESSLTQQRQICRRYEDELREIQIQYSKVASEAESKIREYTLREDRLKSQLNTQTMTFQQTEKVLQSQISELSRIVERERELRTKAELDAELVKSNLEHLKQREESLNSMIRTLKDGENRLQFK
jgi:chromosome segregation ATPase